MFHIIKTALEEPKEVEDVVTSFKNFAEVDDRDVFEDDDDDYYYEDDYDYEEWDEDDMHDPSNYDKW